MFSWGDRSSANNIKQHIKDENERGMEGRYFGYEGHRTLISYQSKPSGGIVKFVFALIWKQIRVAKIPNL